MVQVTPVPVGEAGTAIGITVSLPRTTLIMIRTDLGYIMCGALDVRLLDEKLTAREIVAGRAVGVHSIEDLLEAPLEDVTRAAEALGISRGMSGRDALSCMLHTPSTLPVSS